MKPKVLVIYGATGSQKTAVSMALSKLLDIEIISADSRQIYRELNIGTATPTNDQLNAVPHHFINEKSILEPYSCGEFFFSASRRIQDIMNRIRYPVVVGGSTLYIKTLLHGMSLLPKADPKIRTRLNKELASKGKVYMYDKLCKLDQKQAHLLDSTKTQRVIRSLELIEITGAPISTLLAKASLKKDTSVNFISVFLNIPRPKLYKYIEKRVDDMIKKGLVEEVRQLADQYGNDPSKYPQPLNTIGYKEMLEFFQKKCNLKEAISHIKKNTRNYAKRQLTFFRNQLPVAHNESVESTSQTAEKLKTLLLVNSKTCVEDKS